MYLCIRLPTASEELNDLVTNTFVLFFVKIVGHYSSHIKRNREHIVFQEKEFRKSITSKSIRSFLKRFMVTQMFSLFMEELQGHPLAEEGKDEDQVISGATCGQAQSCNRLQFH